MSNLLGKKVIVVQDSFEQQLPIGEYGYVIARIRDADSAFDYVIRIPKENKQYYVPESDIELEEVVIQRMVDEIEKRAAIDYALATGNKELFEQLVGSTKKDANDAKPTKESPEEFMRKIRLNAYI
jgi:hypothetical protein